MNIGIINLSVDFGETYSEVLRKNDNQVTIMTIDNFEKKIFECDGVIICEDTEQDARHTCSILAKLKERTAAPVWIFSSNFQKIMRFVYLELGSLGVLTDDYEIGELKLIIYNTLNKLKVNHICEVIPAMMNNELDVDKKIFQLIPANRSIKIDKEEILLTRLEYKAIELLYGHRNTVVTYKELSESIWKKESNIKNNQVANLIFNLRKKINDDAFAPILIHTVRSEGYMLNL